MKFNKIYLLPNILTATGLLFGFLGMICALNDSFTLAVYSILAAMVCDTLDGLVATSFGKELDSLSDMVSFGISPAIISYCWGMKYVPFFGVVACYLYVTSAAIRLAKFNTEEQTVGYFSGLPSPAAAATVISHVWFGEFYGLNSMALYIISLLFLLQVTVLMVAPIPFSSLKQINLDEWKTTNNFALAFAVIILFFWQPALIFLLSFIVYIATNILDFFGILKISDLAKKLKTNLK